MTPRDARLRKTYGITEAQFKAILAKQGHVCWICYRLPEPGKNLCVDHVHQKGGGGAIRGLLCRHCNHRVVGRHKDPELLLRASEYLRQHTGYFTPTKAPRRKKRRVKR